MSTSHAPAEEPRDSVEGVPAASSTSNEAQQLPPSLPSQSTSHLTSNAPLPVPLDPSRPQWPSGFVLFFDPTSERAVRLGEELASQNPTIAPLTTSSMHSATHIIIDTPSSTFGDALALVPSFRDQHHVTLDWIYQSILKAEWEAEKDYLISSLEGKKSDQEDGELAKKEEQEEEGKFAGLNGGNAVFEDRWFVSEDDHLARFLASFDDLAAREEKGQDAFDAYVRQMSTQRTANDYRKHFHLKRDAFFDYRVSQLREEAAFLEVGSALLNLESGEGKGKETEVVASSGVDGSGRRTRARVAAVEKRGIESSDVGENADTKPAELPTSGAWIKYEIDALTRFLLSSEPGSYTTKDEIGDDVFDRFAATKDTRRSASACRQYYKTRRIVLDTQVLKLMADGVGEKKGEMKVEMSSSAASKKVRKGKKGSASSDEAVPPSDPSDDESDFDDEDYHDENDGKAKRNTSKLYHTLQEDADLRRFLRESATVTEAADKMTNAHPHRKATAIRSFVSTHKQHFANDLPTRGRGRPPRRGGNKSAGRGEKSQSVEQEQFSGPDPAFGSDSRLDGGAGSHDASPNLPSNSSSVSQAYSNSFPSQANGFPSSSAFSSFVPPSNISNENRFDGPSSSFATSSTRTSDHPSHPIASSPVVATNLPQQPKSRPSSSHASSTRPIGDTGVQLSEGKAQRKKPKLEMSSRNEPLPPPLASSAFAVASNSNPPVVLRPPAPFPSSRQHQPNHQHQYHPHQPLPPPPQPIAFQHSLSQSSPSQQYAQQQQPREPPTFLLLGTPPSFHVPPAPFCWFCGNDRGPTYTTFHLAAPNFPSGELVKIEGKMVCTGCSSAFERDCKAGGEFLKGVREMNEMERLSWVREKLGERGLLVRSREVVGGGGGV